MDEREPRAPAVAGLFYPADPDALAGQVDRLLDAVPVTDAEPLAPAYVVPHAGYRYSGPVAAHVYARLRPHAGRIRRAILIGPAHRVPVAGCVVPAAGSWLTPLGEVPVDTAAVATLVGGRYARADDRPLAPEHSLEVQLPFLQRATGPGRGAAPDAPSRTGRATGPGRGAAPDAPSRTGYTVPVLPMVVGASTPDDVARTLAAAVAATGPGTVVLCSTDLSHYRDEAAAYAQDSRTVQAVLDVNPARIGRYDACGSFALRGLLGYARDAGLRPALLHRGTSADASGDRARVVGYAAFSLSASPGK
ncbi:AmmeMemoRadiSam system protein B [Rugosimonospora africana]|uniref:MEMO1 family protein n=1 Tax=Rugosimonospora africana TaxID=556532 RepID=A0A8J3VPF0_9ACTN|nr:AmmeMemoRadiSam system protein B [Rugosimonospora africana]GIH13331.1 MEMO1 family protein [Rugosimonospora africana]